MGDRDPIGPARRVMHALRRRSEGLCIDPGCTGVRPSPERPHVVALSEWERDLLAALLSDALNASVGAPMDVRAEVPRACALLARLKGGDRG